LTHLNKRDPPLHERDWDGELLIKHPCSDRATGVWRWDGKRLLPSSPKAVELVREIEAGRRLQEWKELDPLPRQQNRFQWVAREIWLEEANASWDALTQQIYAVDAHLTGARARLKNLQRIRARGDAPPRESRVLAERVAGLEAEVAHLHSSLEKRRMQRARLEQQFDTARLKLAGRPPEGARERHRSVSSLTHLLSRPLLFLRQMRRAIGKRERSLLGTTNWPEVW
jgi:hypothetical protein